MSMKGKLVKDIFKIMAAIKFLISRFLWEDVKQGPMQLQQGVGCAYSQTNDGLADGIGPCWKRRGWFRCSTVRHKSFDSVAKPSIVGALDAGQIAGNCLWFEELLSKAG